MTNAEFTRDQAIAVTLAIEAQFQHELDRCDLIVKDMVGMKGKRGAPSVKALRDAKNLSDNLFYMLAKARSRHERFIDSL